MTATPIDSAHRTGGARAVRLTVAVGWEPDDRNPRKYSRPEDYPPADGSERPLRPFLDGVSASHNGKVVRARSGTGARFAAAEFL
jgi:hypothetical protein